MKLDGEGWQPWVRADCGLAEPLRERISIHAPGQQPLTLTSSSPQTVLKARSLSYLQKSASLFGNCSHTANTLGRDPFPREPRPISLWAPEPRIPAGSHVSSWEWEIGDSGRFKISSRSLGRLLCIYVYTGL